MNNIRVAGIALAIALAVGAVGLHLHQSRGSSAATRDGTGSPGGRDMTVAIPRNGAEANALLARPEVREYRARMDFQDNARRFFAEAATLDDASRIRQAQALESGINRYEEAGELSAGESVMLRIGLIRATETDQAAQIERISELVARYQVHAERRNAAFLQAQRNDVAFNSYKARESRIVAEVMAMKSIPGGLSRNEYLRQRLQREREIAYGGGPS